MTVADTFRRTALPLASYYAVTLGLPLANGAAASASFVRHALVVLVVPQIAILLVCGLRMIARAGAARSGYAFERNDLRLEIRPSRSPGQRPRI